MKTYDIIIIFEQSFKVKRIGFSIQSSWLKDFNEDYMQLNKVFRQASNEIRIQNSRFLKKKRFK